MKKKLGLNRLTASFLSLLLALSVFVPAAAFAESKPVSVQVDGELVQFDAQGPIIENGATLVPLDKLSEVLATSIELTDSPKVIDGVTYVPVRSAGQAAGFDIYWDEASRTVILKSKTKPVAASGRGFLWEVQDGNNKVYLLGSMHLADQSFYPLDPAIEDAFAESNYLGVEVDVTKAADPDVQKIVMELGMYQDGTTLKDHISETTYAKLGKILSESGLERNAFDLFKPWFVEMTLQSLQSAASGYDGAVGIDYYFVEKALERKIPVIELESYESQLGMFNSFSAKLQEDNLLAVLNHFYEVDDSVDAMAEMWKTGDDASLLELVNAMGQNEEYNKAMLVDRNIAMADKIEGYLQDSTPSVYMIVVGAAHMPGDYGIVKLLEDKGFTVVRK